MLSCFLNKRNLLFALGGIFLVILVLVLSILGYFIWGYKGKENVNFVFLGEGGPGHEGEDLTDSMIFTSVSKKGTILVSLPRDLWYQPWQTKVNTLYYYGQQKGDGFGWTKKILGEITGQQIDHVILIDFQIFQDLVDLVGGIDVVVDRTFDDFFYPIAGEENNICNGDKRYKCRYESIHFDAGLQHMDGQMALKFVRSRNAEGDEGTDSARSTRQQKVIFAIKQKLLSKEFLLSYSKIKSLEKVIRRRFKGDLPDNRELIDLAKIFLSPQARTLYSFVLDGWQQEDSLIYHPTIHPSKQWVLLPKDSSWEEINNFVGCLIYQEDKSLCSQTQKPLSPAF